MQQVRERIHIPIIRALEGYVRDGIVRFHMPGHKGGYSASPAITGLLGDRVFPADVTNVPGMDDLHQAEGVIRQAEALAASTFGADETFFLINGASCGLQALVLATCNHGDRVLIPRNMHRSLLSGLILSGAVPVFYDPVYDSDLGMYLGVRPEAVGSALESCPEARAVFIVNPTYHGVSSDLDRISTLAHAHGVPLVVDEAHGPHFRFHEELPPTALECGADACVQGSHKTLSAFTQAAMLHVRGHRIDHRRLQGLLCFLQSTSTSYLLLASLDATRAQMEQQGHELVQQALELSDTLRYEVNRISGLFSFDEEWLQRKGNFLLDRTKVTISVRGMGLTGLEAEERLRQEYGIQMEMSDVNSLLALVSYGNTMSEVRRLTGALRAIASLTGGKGVEKPSFHPPPPSVLSLSPREAFLSRVDSVLLPEANGRISAEMVACYPPGIPVLIPGERITQRLIDYLTAALRMGVHLQGPVDPNLKHIRVVA